MSAFHFSVRPRLVSSWRRERVTTRCTKVAAFSPVSALARVSEPGAREEHESTLRLKDAGRGDGGPARRARGKKRKSQRALISIALSLQVIEGRSTEKEVGSTSLEPGAPGPRRGKGFGTARCLPRGRRGGESRLHGWSGGETKGAKGTRRKVCWVLCDRARAEGSETSSSFFFPLFFSLPFSLPLSLSLKEVALLFFWFREKKRKVTACSGASSFSCAPHSLSLPPR